ncbi:MAG: hypothetical protein WBQ79_01810 [Acidobacteriaceae bacterium]
MQTPAFLCGYAAELLPEQDELDRTLAYKQRAQREQFLEDTMAAEAEQRELFRRLEFRVTIRPAEARDLKRVGELINNGCERAVPGYLLLARLHAGR